MLFRLSVSIGVLCTLTLAYVDKHVDFLKLCKGDTYCVKFCPYMRSIYLSALPVVAPCALGVSHIVRCDEERHVCSHWCAHLHAQMHETVGKPAEWEPCASGELPDGCDQDPNCVKWCDYVKYAYQNTTAQVRSCLKTGVALPNCNDQELCQDICSTSKEGMLSPKVPLLITNCLALGHP